MMQIVRRFWYVFALFVLALSLFIGFSVSGILLSPHTPGSTRPMSSNTPLEIPPHPHRNARAQPPHRPGSRVIPAVGVNAPIEPGGRLPGGAMDVPVQRRWDGVGWYQYGPRPGEQGSAVIDGHLDRPGGSPAIFSRLGELHVGCFVMVVNTRKQTLRLQVRQIATYQPASAPLQQGF